jgi:hypothetical protein
LKFPYFLVIFSRHVGGIGTRSMLRCQPLGREASGLGDPLRVEPEVSALSDAEVVSVTLAVGG